MNLFICKVCGHVEFSMAPEKCPECTSPKSSYVQNDNVFIESEEKSKEAAVKHIPAIKIEKQCSLIPEQSCIDVAVRIGATLHPMEEAHHITFIDCYVDGKFVSRVVLTPGVWAAGNFHLKSAGSKITIVENCNIHGYWMAEAAV